MSLKKHSFAKKLFISLFVFLAILALFLSLFPWIVSTNAGKNLLVSFLSRTFSAKIEVKELSLNWAGPQTIEGLSYYSTDGKIKFSSEKINSDSPLLKILLPSHNIGLLHIQSPLIEIHQHLLATPIQQRPQIQTASLLGSIQINQFIPLFTSPFTGHFNIEQGQVTVFPEGLTPIIFSEITCNILTLKNSSEISISLRGTTLQKEVKGTLFVESFCENLGTPERSVSGKINLKNFPVEGADEILSLGFPDCKNLLREAIGSSLNMEFQVQLSKENCLATLNAQSENLQAKIHTEFDGNQIKLSAPGTLTVSITPSLFQKTIEKIPTLKPFTSKTPIQLFLSLDQLSIPKTETEFALKSASFNGKLGIKTYQTDQKSLTIGVEGTFSSANISEDVSTELRSKLQNKEVVSEISASLTLKRPLDSSRELLSSLNISTMPTALLENLLSLPVPLADFLGTSIEASATLTGTEKNLVFSPSLKSPLLQMQNGVFQLQGKELTLINPLQITYSAHPAVLNYALGQDKIALKREAMLSATLSSLKLPDIFYPENLQMHLHANSSSLSFSKLFTMQNYDLKNTSLDLQVDSFNQISLNAQSDLLSLQWTLGLDTKTHTISWKNPAKIQYFLTNQDFSQFYVSKTKPTLLENAPIELQIDPASVILDDRFIDQVQISGKLHGKLFSFENNLQTRQVHIQDLQAEFLLSGADDALKFSLSSEILSPSLKTGKINFQGSFKHLRSKKDLLLKTTLDLQSFPLELLDTLAASFTPLEPLLGSPLNLKLTIEKTSETSSCQINSKSPLLEINGGVQFNSKGIFLAKAKEPLELTLSLTPNSFSQLLNSPSAPFLLAEKTLLKASLSELTIPFLSTDSYTPDLTKTLLKAEIKADQILFKHKQLKEQIQLEATSISLKKSDSQSPLTLTLDSSTSSSQKGSVHIDAKFKQLFDPKGAFKLAHVHSDISVNFQKFPSPILDMCFSSNNAKHQPLSSLLGPSIDAQVETSLQNLSGPLALQISSQNVKLSLSGKLNSGTLTLDKNASAQVILTPESSQVFLSEVNPLSVKSISAAKPLSIEIDAKGFSFPLSPFSFKKVEVPKIRILLGKVLCQNGGNINLMLGLLKSKQTDQSKLLELWFAPLDLHIHQGILDLERTEILVASTYDIALWGKIDFPGNRVNMVLGLTASTLKTAFKIQDLPSDYVLQIPLAGTLDHVDLNKSVATSKIVALTLWQKGVSGAAGSVGGNIGGALFGGVLNRVLTPPGNEGKTPPAKTPFPWQTSSKAK